MRSKQRPRPSSTQCIGAILALGIVCILLSTFKTDVPTARHEQLGSQVAETVDRAETRYNPYTRKSKNRLAIIIPYLPDADGAPTFPPYFDLFTTSAAGSADKIDFLIFHCFVPPSLMPNEDALPANVKLIDMNEDSKKCGLSRLFTRVTDERQKNNEMKITLEKLTGMLSTQIIDYPYILVEYKPAFGHIFADYIEDYSHWGYSDLDVVFGDVTRWIDDDEWNGYDIVTYGFGDQDRLYLRGQFTFHRNDPMYINQIWRHCRYLSKMDVRYATKHIKFESAEGCYSQAVISRKDIKVKWAVKAFTDVGEKSPIYTQGVYLSFGSPPSLTSSISYHPKSVLYTASSVETGASLLRLSSMWFEDKSKHPKYLERKLPIQKLVGERTQVETYRMLQNKGVKVDEEIKCMYWAPATYQLDICTVEGNVASDDVITLEHGVLYKQKFQERQNKLFPDGIKSFPFFHFQEWKRVYRRTELLPVQNARRSSHGLVVTKEGVLPMLSISPSKVWNFKSTTLASAWVNSDTGASLTKPSSNQFCLTSAPKTYPKGATLCELAAAWPQPEANKTINFDSTYLASVNILRQFRGGTKVRGDKAKSSTWWDTKHIDANGDVTLALTVQISEHHMMDKETLKGMLAAADSNIFAWGTAQPCVLLIYLQSEKRDVHFTSSVQLIKEIFGHDGLHLKNTLVAIVDAYEPSASRKALLNMATSAAPTRWVVSGIEVERGLILSSEASVYAARQAKAYSDLPGHAFVLPQFASNRDAEDRSSYDGRLIFDSIGAELLPSIRDLKSMTSNLAIYDCVACSGDDANDEDDDAVKEKPGSSSSEERSAEQQLEDLWWDMSIAEVYGTAGGFKGDAKTSLSAMAKTHDRLEVALISLLDRRGDHKDYLRSFGKSPIILVDRLGPHEQMRTLDLAPETEEFGGRSCFNLLRLAQLATLGYKISVLPGAFAVSFPKSRNALCTEAMKSHHSCGCDIESDEVTREVLQDEAKRVGKLAVFQTEAAML